MHKHGYQILVAKTIFNKINQGSLKKCLILGLHKEIHKIRLEHFVVLEIKKY